MIDEHGKLFLAPARPDARSILFCLPYAGAGASAFRGWRRAFPAAIDVQPIQLPGRENRIAEAPTFDADSVARAIARRADRPFAIYGHSMGARLGFDVIRALRRSGSPLPVRLYVGGCYPPDVVDSFVVRIARLPDDEFIPGLEEFGGTPAGVLDHPELRELLMPVLRADFAWLDQYRCHEEDPLPVPIVAFAGLADRLVQPGQMEGWARHTSAGFQLHAVPGDHFFLISDVARLRDRITRDFLEIAPAEHRLPLPGTEWFVWRRALLRTTGFPATGLTRLACPDLAAVADSPEHDPGAFAEAYAAAAARVSREIWAITEDPRFREAVTWQNRNALYAVDGIRKQGPVAARNSKRRQREEMVAQYWQRYCAKNETVGFFGPSVWIDLDPDGPAIVARPGAQLVRDRQVFFEYWALAAYADAVAADPRVKPWLAPSIAPYLCLQGRSLIRIAQPPLPLSAAEATLLAQCDGRRPAIDVAAAAVAEPGSPLRTTDDALILLAQLAERALVRWDLDLPVRMQAEQILAQRLGTIGDAEARQQARAGLERLRFARDAVKGGDPDRLKAALGALDETFSELTGQLPQRRAGQMYAGRTLVVEECVRDLTATIGGPVLEAIAAPLAILLQAARWLCAATADAYVAVL
ncbi:MAG: thioesterase domain-containing protein, partial [Micromonosporaceae bacterium]